ncbi:hypothetical protein NP493_692g06000 [Ridgeia piscesae]|uniref:Uncharacterized protein n=1 Tax=Ridgeia piscesae TaxID=27915 RepID=A0AAD9KRG7_RIDPI|nr:hypothetical protein NP493_692g06000 [Ridgeia piscesae]
MTRMRISCGINKRKKRKLQQQKQRATLSERETSNKRREEQLNGDTGTLTFSQHLCPHRNNAQTIIGRSITAEVCLIVHRDRL